MGGERVHSQGQAGGRPLQGSGWSKYTLLKCSEGMAPPTPLPKSTLQPSGCKCTHSISSTHSLDP